MKVMNNRRNYYRILHVQHDAPLAVIKASYRAQMQKLKLHPDLGGCNSKAAVINQAYATLSSKEKRAAYDTQLNMSQPSSAGNHQTAKKQSVPTVLQIAGYRSGYKPDSTGRNLERQLQNTPLHYFTAENKTAQPGTMRDLSPSGLQLQTSEPLTNTQVIKLACDALTATVRVKYCKESKTEGLYDVGVEFLTSHFCNRQGTFFSAVVS